MWAKGFDFGVLALQLMLISVGLSWSELARGVEIKRLRANDAGANVAVARVQQNR